MRVSLVIFSWNEIDGMKAIMPWIKRQWYDELIIVDGGSTDGLTFDLLNYLIIYQKESEDASKKPVL